MRVLLDTHVFIWWDSEPTKLSATALNAITDPANEVLLSVASVWELVIKSSLGKLTLRMPLRDLLLQQRGNGIELLTVSAEHVLAVEALPPIHKDPFDRLLIAQSAVEGATFVSADDTLAAYGKRPLW
jgi:PIN domain nuclease of toxin-antitoxin system